VTAVLAVVVNLSLTTNAFPVMDHAPRVRSRIFIFLIRIQLMFSILIEILSSIISEKHGQCTEK